MVFRCAAAGLAHETHGVRIIHHHQGVVAVGQRADHREVGNVAIHRENAVRGNQFEPRAFGFHELSLQVFHVVVQVAKPLRFAQADPVNDAGMIQFIGDDGVFGSEQCLEEASIGIETGAIENRIFRSQELAEFRFELFVDALGAADESNAGQAIAPFIECGFCGGGDRRMLRQPEIIVSAKV